MQRRIAVYVTDLIFSTKIMSTARSLDVAVEVVRSAAGLSDRLAGGGIDLVIIDLTADGDPVEAVRAARRAENTPRIVAFCPHVQIDLADAAREAGADEVLPRSAFSQDLPGILRATSASPDESR